MMKKTVSLLVSLFIAGASASLHAAGFGLKLGYDSYFHNGGNVVSLGGVFDNNLATVFPLNYRADFSFKVGSMQPGTSPYHVWEDFFVTRQALGFRIFASPMHTVFVGPHLGLAIGQREFSDGAIINIGLPMGVLLGYNLHITKMFTMAFDCAYNIDLLYSLFALNFKHGVSLSVSFMFRLPNDNFNVKPRQRFNNDGPGSRNDELLL